MLLIPERKVTTELTSRNQNTAVWQHYGLTGAVRALTMTPSGLGGAVGFSRKTFLTPAIQVHLSHWSLFSNKPVLLGGTAQ